MLRSAWAPVAAPKPALLRRQPALVQAAVGIELVVHQRHARRVVELRRCVPAVDHHGVERVEDVRPELEPAAAAERESLRTIDRSTVLSGQPRM